MIPTNEFTIEFTKSSGPGGQNVNKVATKAQLHWKIGVSFVFTDEEKDRIRQKLKNRINKEDEVVLYSEKERSQLQNKENVIELLNNLVEKALETKKIRKKTRPTRGSITKRLDEKTKHSRKKQMRKKVVPPPFEGRG